MNNQSSISILSNLEESFFRYFRLKEFNNPEYDPRNNPPERIFDKSLRLTKTGLSYTLTLANWLGKQLADFKDNFILGEDRSEYVSRKASELHQILDQMEDVRTRLKTSTLPLVQHIINNELSSKGIEKLLDGGHSLTDFSEHCALKILDYINEFDPRGTANDYYTFVRERVKSRLYSLIRSFYVTKKDISWEEFKEALDSGLFNLEDPLVNSLMSEIPRKLQRIVLTKLYGLDGKKETKEELAKYMNKSLEGIERLEKQVLTCLGIKIDPVGFLNSFHGKDSRKELERTNRTLWKYLESRGGLNPSLRRDYDYNPINIYRNKYPGVSRGKLPYIDDPLYLALKYHNQLHLVPTQKDLEEQLQTY